MGDAGREADDAGGHQRVADLHAECHGGAVVREIVVGVCGAVGAGPGEIIEVAGDVIGVVVGGEPRVDCLVTVGLVFSGQQRVQVRHAACAAEMTGQMPKRVAAIYAGGAWIACEQGEPAVEAAEAGQVDVADAVVGSGGCVAQLIGQGEQFVWLLVIG